MYKDDEYEDIIREKLKDNAKERTECFQKGYYRLEVKNSKDCILLLSGSRIYNKYMREAIENFGNKSVPQGDFENEVKKKTQEIFEEIKKISKINNFDQVQNQILFHPLPNPDEEDKKAWDLFIKAFKEIFGNAYRYSSQKGYCEVSINTKDIKNLIMKPEDNFDRIWTLLSVEWLVLLQYLTLIRLDLQGLCELMKLERTGKIREYLKECKKDGDSVREKIDKLNKEVPYDIKEKIKRILEEINIHNIEESYKDFNSILGNILTKCT